MQKNFCEICRCEVESELFISSCDKHEFCSDCLFVYLSNELPKYSKKLRCPGIYCSNSFNVNLLKRIVKSDSRFNLLAHHLANINRFCKLEEGNHSECPFQDCGYLNKQPWFRKMLRCAKCSKSYCFFCRKETHSNQLCLADRKENLSKLKSNGRLVYCPGCSIPVEKADGCNSMSCIRCLTKFCWLCGWKIWRGHYHFLNPLGCKSPYTSRDDWVYYRRGIRLLFWTLLLVLLYKLTTFFISLRF